MRSAGKPSGESCSREGLGSLRDKSERVSRLAGHIAKETGQPEESVRLARRAGLLCKCDLVTEVVGEFPELQGVMGGEYARRGGEPEALALAIGEHYRPGFAGDGLPTTRTGQALAIADRLDTLAGIFAIGKTPSGDRDPFGLRRAALGVLRILIEGELDLDLENLLSAAARSYARDGEADTPGPSAPLADPATDREAAPVERRGTAPPNVAHASAIPDEQTLALLRDFLVERLRTYFASRGVPATVFAAVHARRPSRPLDFARRIHAVDAFRRRPEAESLAAANKRIGNILRQADYATTHTETHILDSDPEPPQLRE